MTAGAKSDATAARLHSHPMGLESKLNRQRAYFAQAGEAQRTFVLFGFVAAAEAVVPFLAAPSSFLGPLAVLHLHPGLPGDPQRKSIANHQRPLQILRQRWALLAETLHPPLFH